MGPTSQGGFVHKRLQGVFYGWWLVAISGLVMVMATVPLFHAMSVWAVALERHFGWSRTQLGFALTFTRIRVVSWGRWRATSPTGLGPGA